MLKLSSKTLQSSVRLTHHRSLARLTSAKRFYCEKKDTEKEITISEKELENQEIEAKLSGFAKAFQKFSEPAKEEAPETPATFESLLKNSNFIEMGDPVGKVVAGKIFHVVDDDLYIDFGWKFHCVCTRPSKNSAAYVRGARVKLKIKDLELSTRFLGSSKDLTLLEADCQLLGLLSSPAFPPRTSAPSTSAPPV